MITIITKTNKKMRMCVLHLFFSSKSEPVQLLAYPQEHSDIAEL